MVRHTKHVRLESEPPVTADGRIAMDARISGDLVIGTSAANTNLRGKNGDDCILGGGGNDMLRGDGGTDVCIGGPRTDTFDASCETQIE